MLRNLLEDIVLDRSGHLLKLGALFESGVDIECQHGEHRTVHGHRYRHLVEGYAVEEHLHVVERADRHACLAHIAHNTGMIGVIAAVSSEVEGHRQSLLAGREVAAVESVGFSGCGESGILADSPWTHRIHGAVRAAEERRKSRHVVEVFESFEIALGIDWFYGDEFGREPFLTLCLCGDLNRSRKGIFRYVDILKIGSHCKICLGWGMII